MAAFELPYFAYGSNLDLKQMRERCPDSKHGLRATLPGYRLIFVWQSKRWNGGGVASIQAHPEHRVPGLLYDMTRADMETLNGFEGFPKIYDHLYVEVMRGDGSLCKAITFQHQMPTANPPAKEYFDLIWNGYRHFGLGEEHLFHAARTALSEAALNRGGAEK